nr:hypothetical protein [Tanacetum cinerariifolium]
RKVVIDISRPPNRVVTGTTVIIMTVMDQTGEAVPRSPGVHLRATPTRFALRVDADTQESVIELLVPASSVVKLAICRRIARRTPLRLHLVRLIRSQVHQVAFLPSLRIMLLKPQNTMLRSTVVHIESSLVTFMHLSLFIMVPYQENLCRSFQLYKHMASLSTLEASTSSSTTLSWVSVSTRSANRIGVALRGTPGLLGT